MTQEIAGIVLGAIGAAAWLPYLIKMFSKSKLIVIPPSTCVIGYTELGPIFNLNVAIAAENKDVLINNIEFNIQHESGDKYSFSWHEILEIKGLALMPDGRAQSIQQESEAIAFKVLPTDFKNPLLRNRMKSHTQKYERCREKFDRERRRLVNANKYDPLDFFVSPPVSRMQTFMQSQMIWKEGRYNVGMSIDTLNPVTADLPKFSFYLSDNDIVSLQANCTNMPKLVKNWCFTDIALDEEIVPLEWNWQNKSLTIIDENSN